MSNYLNLYQLNLYLFNDMVFIKQIVRRIFMDSKIIEFSIETGWEWFIQLFSIGWIIFILATSVMIFAILVITFILLIRKLKKKN